MRLTIRVLGVELVHIDLDTDAPSPAPDRGDCTTYPVGFVVAKAPPMTDIPERE